MFWHLSVCLSVHRGVPQSGPIGGGGYPSQVRPGGVTPARSDQGYPSQVQGCTRGGVPPGRGTPRTGQQMEYLIRRIRYVSCVHAGGLSYTLGLIHILFLHWSNGSGRNANSSISKCFSDKEYHLCFHLTDMAVAFLFQCFRDRHLGIVQSICLYEALIFSNVSSGNSLDTRISFALKELLFLGQGFSIGRFLNRKSYRFENNIAHFYIDK